MLGLIKFYNPDKGFGFITDENNTDRFFHISDVIGSEIPSEQQKVSFTPSENEKGLNALNINLLEPTKHRPSFFSISNKRIKLSNIKDYGIYDSRTYYQTVFKDYNPPRDERTFQQKLLDISDSIEKTTVVLMNIAGDSIGYSGDFIDYSDVDSDHKMIEIDSKKANSIINGNEFRLFMHRNIKSPYEKGDKANEDEDLNIKGELYLYITTFQGDNHKFYYSEEFLKKKLEELDSFFNV